MIAIIDYRAGNSASVLNAFNKLDIDASLVTTPDALKSADGIILPGVGSAAATMSSLVELNLIETLNHLCRDGSKPFLGICVGLQVLFEHSDEGDVDCLGWLSGRVTRFDSAQVRVPQMGWNLVQFQRETPLNSGILQSYLYFVNSYHAQPTNRTDLLATSNYGGEFCALVQRENIFASQCHLEKSGSAGLRLLKNFADFCIGGALC